MIRCEKIKNFHHFETNKENEVLRPIRPPNSLRGRRSDMTSDLKFMAQITYATMFVWTVLALFGPNGKSKEDRRQLATTRVACLHCN